MTTESTTTMPASPDDKGRVNDGRPADGQGATTTSSAELATHAAKAGPGHANPGIDFAKETHANIQDLVKVADAKATSLIALQGLVLVIFGSSLATDIAAILRSSAPGAGRLMVVGAAMLTLTLLSILLGVGVLVPRDPQKTLTRPSGARGLLWLKDLERYERDPQSYLATLRQTTDEDRLADFAFENLKVAWILRRKFKFLRAAIWVLIFALIAWVATIVAVVGTPLPPTT